MTIIVNTGQAQAWNGYEGEHWAAHDTRYDAVNSGFNPFLLRAADLGGTERVLDVGCGNGQLSRIAARHARRVTGVDLSVPMLTRARARAAAENISNVSFVQGDVQVHPFASGSFDVALSRFAVMFFADPVAAFANVRRALRPRGRLAFVCLTELAGTDLGAVFGALAPYLTGPAGLDVATATSFADSAHVTAVLTKAGFTDVAHVVVEADQVWGRDIADATEFILGWGPVRHHLASNGPAADGARAALSAALGAFAHPDAVRLRGTAWLFTAVAAEAV